MIGWRSFLSHFSWVYVGWRSQGFLNQQLWTIKQGMSVSICDVKSLKFFEGSVTSDQWSVVNFCSMELIYCYNADIHDNNYFQLSLFQVLILRNYGAICVGETIEETAYLAYLLVTACEQQVCGMSRELMVIPFPKLTFTLQFKSVKRWVVCMQSLL